MISTFDYLGLRRMPINYFSPAVCDADFSSTSEPSIVLEPFIPVSGPSGPLWGMDGNDVRLHWTSYPGAICYSVYRAVDALDPYGEYVLVSECTEDTSFTIPAANPLTDCGYFRISAITAEGETELSEPVFVDCCHVSYVWVTSSSGFDPVIFGTNVTLTAWPLGDGPEDVTGTIIFYDGAIVLGTVVIPPGMVTSLDVDWLIVGSHAIHVHYSGDPNNCPSDSSLHTQVIEADIP